MTGFSARADGAVLVGRVFVPPERRGRGHARRAVALHLLEARAAGTERAVLAASGEAAERAYRAIGFRPVGRAGMAELPEPGSWGAPSG
jgi:predicted GNAT family acetyltransferase